MKKKLALLLSVVMVMVGITACGDKNEASNAGSGKELVVEIGPDPETIDPALNSAVDGGNMILHTFECLLTVDKEGKIAAGQAEEWESSEDGLTWTFHLRDGLKWSDGSALTANDFVYSWKRVCDPVVAAPYGETVLNMVKGYAEAAAGNLDALGVSAPDDKTFVVELSSPCPYFESLAAFATLSPVQQSTIEKNGDGWAIAPETYTCNGPFYISEWVPGSHITMSKNTNYWNAGAIKLDTLKFLLMQDANAAYTAYKAGEVSLIKDVPPEEIPNLKGNPEYHVDYLMGTYYLSMNLGREAFASKEFRQALSLSIDREYVANTLMQGTYTPATNFVGPGWMDTDGKTEFIKNANGGKPYIDSSDHEANVAKAKELMVQAGYSNGEGAPTISYTTNPEGFNKTVAEYLQQAFAEIGVTLNIDIVEWKSFTPTRRNGDYEMARNGWSCDYNDPSNILELLTSTNGNNDGKFNNADFDAAIDASRVTMDIAERSAQLHKAEDIIMEEAACIPLAYYNDFYLQKEDLTGIWHSPYGYWFFMYADV